MTSASNSSRRLLLAGIAGNMLEWFDFAVYGFFAVIIGKLFFPAADPVAQVIAAFGVFAVGFLMRPIGGVLLGYVGDKYGRHKAMLISVAAMAIPTFLVGSLPTYATLGLAAPILLLILRMIQGLSVGGEYTTSVVYMIENTPEHRRGFVGSFAVSGAVLGILMGSGVGALLAALLSEEQLQSWGWRIPFWCGLFLGLAGLWLRRQNEAQTPQEPKTEHPLKTAWREHRQAIWQISGLSLVTAVVFYLIFVYVVSWLELVDGIPASSALEINSESMVFLLAVMLFSGWLSDKVGARLILLVSAAMIGIFAWPLFWLLHSDNIWSIMAGQFGFALVIGGYLGAQPAYMVKIIPANVRCTAAGLAYNITLGLAGGLSPMVATWLVQRTGDDLSPAFLIIAAAIVSWFVVRSIPKHH